jgi:hypothetical protein
METHAMSVGSTQSIIGHSGKTCPCKPVRVPVFDKMNRGRLTKVYYVHYSM